MSYLRKNKQPSLWLLSTTLLVSIVASLLLLTTRQSLKSTAYTGAGPAEDGQYGSTPTSQLTQFPRSPTGINKFLFFPLVAESPQASFDFLARNEDYYIFDMGGSVTGNPAVLKQKISEMKALNPNLKVLVHFGGIATQAPFMLPYKYLNTGGAGEINFLHHKDAARSRIHFVANNQPTDQEFVNVADPNARQNYVNALRSVLVDIPQIDGFMLDGYVTWSYQMPSDGCIESDVCNVDNYPQSNDYWLSSYLALTAKIKTDIPDKLFFFNGFNARESRPFGPSNSGYIVNHDAVFAEDTYAIYTTPEVFYQTLKDMREQVVNAGKKVFFHITPWKLSGIDQLDVPIDLNLERFYLAAFLLINQRNLTYFGYEPSNMYSPGALFFYKDQHLDFGNPVEGMNGGVSTNLYWRTHEKGITVVNTSTSSQTFTFPPGFGQARDWVEGELVSGSVTIPPKSGHFYMRTVFISPTITPTVTVKPWDIGGNPDGSPDGRVNIQDYALLFESYGKKPGYSLYHPRADINNDGKVNILDYVILFENFGH